MSMLPAPLTHRLSRMLARLGFLAAVTVVLWAGALDAPRQPAQAPDALRTIAATATHPGQAALREQDTGRILRRETPRNTERARAPDGAASGRQLAVARPVLAATRASVVPPPPPHGGREALHPQPRAPPAAARA